MSISTLVGCALLSSAHAQSIPEKIEWKRLGTDLERADFSFSVGALFTSSIVLIRSELQKYKVRSIRSNEFGLKRATIRALCRVSGATVCINANFFDEQGKALGLVISRGIIHQRVHKGGGTLTGILYLTPSAVKIIHRDGFSGGGAIEAVQAGPRLVAGSKPVQGLHDSSFASNLSGACVDKKGRFIMFRVTSGVFGCSIRQLQEILMHPSIGCADAINFDGGGSSQLYINDTIPGNRNHTEEEFFSGLDPIPVAIGLFDTGK